MSQSHYHINGVPQITPSESIRQEFTEFAKDKDVLNLYLLALEKIQKVDQRDLTSHFQIGGIHGLPPIPWDNVNGISNPTFEGYCTHGSVLFPTWHRPYVLLYEQVIWNVAHALANSYTKPELKDKYLEAVNRLRQPYWDWAINPPHPLLLGVEKVDVEDVPNGETRQIQNPLLSYSFHPIDKSFKDNFAIWKRTLRYPKDTSPDAESQPDLFLKAMVKGGTQLREDTFQLLAHPRDWMTFSNHSAKQSSDGLNIESIHDHVHNLVGGGSNDGLEGHMAAVEMAGFDPIFFLHHTNVDRLLAIWQVLHPDVWVTPGPANGGSFTINAEETVNAYSDLTPFHSNDDTFWNSEMSRHTQNVGYTYPETFKFADDPKGLEDYIFKLYGPWFSLDTPQPSSTESKSQVTFSSNPSQGYPTQEGPTRGPIYPNPYRDWYAEVIVNPYHFEKSGYVHIFLSETVPAGGNWLFASERVGNVAIFRNTSGQCANCNRNEAAEEKIIGRVPLTSALLEKGKDVNDIDNLTEYLRTHMHWRCALVNGKEVPLESVTSLQVRLYSAHCERPQVRDGLEGFPIRQEPVSHHSVTRGRLGGYASS